MKYIIRNKKYCGGDYGSALVVGTISFVDYDQDPTDVIYQRTIPFVPDISFINQSAVVARKRFVDRYNDSHITGLRFTPIMKLMFYKLDWLHWGNKDWKYPSDFNAECNGEPHDYYSVLKQDLICQERMYLVHDTGSDGEIQRHTDGYLRCSDKAKDLLGDLNGCVYELA